MQYIVDIVILAILVFSAFRGYKKGLVKTLFGLLSVVLSLVLACTFGKMAGGLIRNTSFVENMSIKVEESIEEYAKANTSELMTQNSALREEWSAIPQALAKYGIDFNELLHNNEDGGENNSLAQKAADSFVRAATNAMGFVAVFLLCLILLKLLGKLFDVVARFSLLKPINKAGGFLAGLVIGVSIVFVLVTVTEFLLPNIPENPVLYPGMHSKTFLYCFFAGLNPIFLILFG